MIPFKRAVAIKDGNVGCDVLAVHGNTAWVLFDGEEWPVTYYLADLEPTGPTPLVDAGFAVCSMPRVP